MVANSSAIKNYMISIMVYGIESRKKLWWTVKDLEKELVFTFGLSIGRYMVLNIINQLDDEGRLEFLSTNKRKKFKLKYYREEEVIRMDNVNVERFGLTMEQIKTIYDISPNTAKAIVLKCERYMNNVREGNWTLSHALKTAVMDYDLMYGQRARREISFMLYVFGYMAGELDESSFVEAEVCDNGGESEYDNE